MAEEAKKVMLSYKRKNNKEASNNKNEKIDETNFSDKTRVIGFKKQI